MAIDRSFRSGIAIILLGNLTLIAMQASAQDQTSRAMSSMTSPSLSKQATELLPLIEQLDSESYRSRQSAKRELLHLGLLPTDRPGGQISQHVLEALTAARGHKSLEVRLAATDLLDQMLLADHDRQMERLLNPHCEVAQIQLDHWESYSRLAGNDMAARSAFAQLIQRFGDLPSASAPSAARDHSLLTSASRLDPYRLKPDDTTGWMLLLLYDLEHRQSIPHLAPRIAVALSHCPMGPIPSREIGSVALNRVIDVWVQESAGPCGQRERLLIAMRYGRRSTAMKLCRDTFESELVSPAMSVTALLAASVLEQRDLAVHAKRHLHDERLAHVWQLVPSRKTRIRTEVRDVALAVLLHHRGSIPEVSATRSCRPIPCCVSATTASDSQTTNRACRHFVTQRSGCNKRRQVLLRRPSSLCHRRSRERNARG